MFTEASVGPTTGGRYRIIAIPTLYPLVLAAIPPALLLAWAIFDRSRRRQRTRRGFCAH